MSLKIQFPKSKTLNLAAVLFLGALTSLVSPALGLPYNDGYIPVLWHWNASTPDTQFNTILDRLAHSPSRNLTFPVIGCQSTITSDDIGDCAAQAPETMFHLAKLAQNRGFKVTFLPIMMTVTWQWRGFFDPARPAEWFKNYEAWLLGILSRARAMGLRPQEFIAGTEFVKLYRYEAQWSALIANLRQHFNGPITLTANWDSLDHGFWRDTDSIGVSAYFPLFRDITRRPTQTELTQAWVEIRDRLLALSRKYSKPIHLTEIGYTASPLTAVKPWEPVSLEYQQSGATPDYALQAMCYRAFFETWKDVGAAALARVNFWSVGDLSVPSEAWNHNVLGTPAFEITEAWLARRLRVSERVNERR